MLLFGPLPLGKKRSYDFTTISWSVSQSVGQSVMPFSPKPPVGFFYNFAWCCVLKVENWQSRKNLILGIMPKNTKKMLFFFLDFSKNMVYWYVIFFVLNSVIIVVNILQKPHVREKSGSQVIFKNALGQSDCKIL